VIGSMMCAWEQEQQDELPSLRHRLPAMSERVWNATVRPERPYAAFARALERTDAGLQALITPVTIDARGLRFPGLRDGHYGEPDWFGDTLVVRLGVAPTAPRPGLVVRYTLDGRAPTAASPAYERPVVLAATTHLRARAFTAAGDPVGHDVWHEYELHPLRAEVRGGLRVPLDSLWERFGDGAPFAGRVTVRLTSDRGGTIRYTLDGSEPAAASPAYTAPLALDSTATVRARLFGRDGRGAGAEWALKFERVE
jgi:hypothetical protein